MLTSSQVLNQALVDKLNEDKKTVHKATLNYIWESTRKFDPPPDMTYCSIDKMAGRITLTVTFKTGDEEKVARGEWTEMEVLAYDMPFTKLIDQVIASVFEAPSEGASVS